MAARADLLIRNSARPDNCAPTRLLVSYVSCGTRKDAVRLTAMKSRTGSWTKLDPPLLAPRGSLECPKLMVFILLVECTSGARR